MAEQRTPLERAVDTLIAAYSQFLATENALRARIRDDGEQQVEFNRARRVLGAAVESLKYVRSGDRVREAARRSGGALLTPRGDL